MSKTTTRPTRTPINGTRQILSVKGKEPGYEYRIVNDEGDRVALMQEQGYEIVTDKDVRIGDRRIANPTQEGTPAKVSVGGGMQGYLMRIKSDWYAEDQAAKQKQVDESEAAMKADAKKFSDYGELKLSRN